MNAPKTFVLLVWVLTAGSGIGRDIYVAVNGAGGGDPLYGLWENAASNLEWAVNAGANGDTVWVSNGTYVLTNQVTVGGNITVAGFTNNGTVIIDGGAGCRCFEFSAGTTGELANLFITGGSAADFGGGVYLRAGTVRDCIFSNNTCANSGGGMFVTNGIVAVERCTFVDNSAYFGAGLCLYASGTSRVDRGVFLGNAADYDVGGLYCMNRAAAADVIITNCDFIGNRAARAQGGAYFNQNLLGSLTVTHCLCASNEASTVGGLEADKAVTITNCVVSYNEANTYTGGIMLRQGTTLRNSLIAYNVQTNTGGSSGGGGIRMYGTGGDRCARLHL